MAKITSRLPSTCPRFLSLLENKQMRKTELGAFFIIQKALFLFYHTNDAHRKLTSATPTLKAPSTGPKPTAKAGSTEAAATAAAATQKYAQELQKIPELASYNGVLKSSTVVELTESETEYVVKAIKHVFKEHVVLQFVSTFHPNLGNNSNQNHQDITNTLPDTVLTDVSIISTPTDPNDADSTPPLEEDFLIPVTRLNTNEPGTVYVAFKNTSGQPYPACNFTNILKFTSKEIDPSTGEPEESGYDDEYQIEDLDLGGADWVLPAFAGSWDGVWDSVSSGDEASETLVLGGSKGITEAVTQLASILSLQPLDGSDVPLSTSTHTLKLYGKTVNGGKVAVMVRMAFSAKTGVTVQIRARTEEDGVAAAVVGSVA
jgi:coatomer subunit gamma